MPDTPDTLNYLLLGLGAIIFFVVVFVASIVIRYRNLQKDVELIEQLREDE
jgi:hypothetical protein